MRDLTKPAGNARIATALVEVLGASGNGARRERVERLLGDESGLRRRRADWIRPELLREVFREGGVDERLAKRVGRALVSPRGIGLLLCYAGIATPEKAYRRADQLLARERSGDRFEPAEIGEGRARVEFLPQTPCPEDAIFCAVRLGMLEALTTLYGLLPAKASEVACAHRGAARCTFEVTWQRVPRTGLAAGGALGLALGAATGLALGLAFGAAPLGVVALGRVAPGPMLLGLSAFGAALLGVLGAAAGRSFDLSRQLGAVAGSRLGHLVLLDQMDGLFAERMDALAKHDRLPEEPRRAAGVRPARASLAGEDEPAAPRVEAGLLRRFNSALGALHVAQLRLANGTEDARVALAACSEASRELRAVGVALSQDAEAAGDAGETADLVEIVRRGIAVVGPGQPDSLEIAFGCEVESAPVRCHPFQIEQVVIQLVMNAAEAVRGDGRIDVALRASPDGFEVAISDRGDGIEPELLDRLFDPFFAPTAAGAEFGLGLTLCYRVIDRHGGELSVQSEPGNGTTVVVVLPGEWNEAPR